jgi:hypothetical protein
VKCNTFLFILFITLFSCDNSHQDTVDSDELAQKTQLIENMLYHNSVNALRNILAQDTDGLIKWDSAEGLSQKYSVAAYPADYALSLLGAYLVSGEEEFLNSCKKQFEYSISLIQNNKLFVVPSSNEVTLTRDSLMRFIAALYMGYILTGNKNYLSVVEDQVDKILTLKRGTIYYESRAYDLFYYYDPDTLEPIPDQIGIIPNQDSETALALALVYTDPDSRYYEDADIMQIINDELSAMVSLTDDDGTLYLANHNMQYSIPYASYTLRTFCITRLLMKNNLYDNWVSKVYSKLEIYENDDEIQNNDSGAALDRFIANLAMNRIDENNFLKLKERILNDDVSVRVAFLRYISLIEFVETMK